MSARAFVLLATSVLAGPLASLAGIASAQDPPRPPAAVSVPALPARVSVPTPPSPSAAPLTGGIRCPVKREWWVRLMGDRGPFRAQWRECKPRRALELPPQQIALWQPGVAALAWGLENTDGENRLLIEKADSVDLDADGLEEILIVMRHEGSGGFTEWCLAGRKGAAIGCWDSPDFEPAAAKLLRADEDFGGRGWQLRALPRGLTLERSVYHKGVDPNCCPTRGSVVVRLTPADGRLAIAAVERRPPDRRTAPAASPAPGPRGTRR